MVSNCPNCGAPVTGAVCEYCGSMVDSVAVAKEQAMLELKMDELRSELVVKKLEAAIAQQSNYILGGMGRWRVGL